MSFSPENSTSSRIPELRPKSVRLSNQTAIIATAATPSSSQREGSGAPLSAQYTRQPYRHSVRSVSHHGARSACGASTMASEAISRASSRVPTGRCSGASGCAKGFTVVERSSRLLERSSRQVEKSSRQRVKGERLQAGGAMRFAVPGLDFQPGKAQAVDRPGALGGEHPAREARKALLQAERRRGELGVEPQLGGRLAGE